MSHAVNGAHPAFHPARVGEAPVKERARHPRSSERDGTSASVPFFPEPGVYPLAVTALAGGEEVVIWTSSIRDTDGLRDMFRRSSLETIYRRFHSPYPQVPEWALAYLTGGDQRNGESLIAVAGKDIVGHAMYVPTGGGRAAEVAVVVEDAWQRKGIGSLLLRKLAVEAGRRGVEVFTAEVLAENRPMLALARAMFAEAEYEVRDGLYRIRAPLRSLVPMRELEASPREELGQAATGSASAIPDEGLRTVSEYAPRRLCG